MTDDKSGEDKLFEGDNAQEEKVSPEDSTGAPAVIKPVQAEIIPDVPIAKSAAPAATAAATASASACAILLISSTDLPSAISSAIVLPIVYNLFFLFHFLYILYNNFSEVSKTRKHIPVVKL